MMKVSDDQAFCARIAQYLFQISQLNLQHPTSISEGIAWAKFLKKSLSYTGDEAIRGTAEYTIGFLAKDNTDRKTILKKVFPQKTALNNLDF